MSVIYATEATTDITDKDYTWRNCTDTTVLRTYRKIAKISFPNNTLAPHHSIGKLSPHRK
jgi:hypothetical protein